MVDPLTESPTLDSSLPAEEYAALRALLEVEGVGPARVGRALLEGATPAQLVPAMAPELRIDAATVESARVELARCTRCTTRVLRAGAPGYPTRFTHLTDPPPLVWLRGNPEAVPPPRGDRAAVPSVAVVGSRRGTAYGRAVAEQIGRGLGRAGVTVVSGLALGVDGAAHSGTLEAGGRTVALLAGGTERASPRSHAGLYRRLLESGAALSENPPGSAPLAHHFPRRNRMIAALADAVVVVEAARKSGALITARLALELGRDVWAVPGRIDQGAAEGTNALIRDGARPVCSVSELVESYAIAGEEGGLSPGSLGGPAPSSVSALAEQIWIELAREALPLEAIRDRLAPDSAPAELLSALTELELSGWIERGAGPAWHRRVA